MIRVAVLIEVIAVGAAPAHAHRPSDARLGLAFAGDTVTGRLDVAVRDLDAAIAIDADLERPGGAKGDSVIAQEMGSAPLSCGLRSLAVRAVRARETNR